MALIPARQAIATRTVPAARASPMATSRLAHADQVVHGQVVPDRAVRARMARVLMEIGRRVTVAQVAVPVIAARVAKAATVPVPVGATVVQHAPRVRTDIRAMPRIFRPTTPIQAVSTPMANARAAIALPVIVRARDHGPVVRAARSQAVPVDRNRVAHAAAIAEESSK